ncbi:MAG: hypothetical protein O2843_12080 [Chloroflexi bacterium]|nr:hypothetical protein [Chloroflexota bacterium]
MLVGFSGLGDLNPAGGGGAASAPTPCPDGGYLLVHGVRADCETGATGLCAIYNADGSPVQRPETHTCVKRCPPDHVLAFRRAEQYAGGGVKACVHKDVYKEIRAKQPDNLKRAYTGAQKLLLGVGAVAVLGLVVGAIKR